MPAKFVSVDRDTTMLLPPDMRDWVPDDHLVHFIIDAVECLDLSGFKINHRGSGSKQYPPSLLVELLVYCYATGRFSSREIEEATWSDVIVRYLCGAQNHPDHSTLCEFRKVNRKAFKKVFVDVLALAQQMKLLKKVGTISVDGTKIKANASKHKAVSFEHAQKQIELLEQEVEQLVKMAENADQSALHEDFRLPDEIARRQSRKEQLEQACEIIRERHKQQRQLQQAQYDEKKKERELARKAGKKPRGKEPVPPPEEPPAKSQYNFTDPESRIMKQGNAFEQCYNAQASVEVDSMLITGNYVTANSNDKKELSPNIEQSTTVAFTPDKVLCDSGYYSEENAQKAQAQGIELLSAVERTGHGLSLEDLQGTHDKKTLPEEACAKERMRHKLRTTEGRKEYALRKQTVEPVFGIIKQVLGFRQFLTRGLLDVGNEWNLVCLSYNLKRMFNLTKQQTEQGIGVVAPLKKA